MQAALHSYPNLDIHAGSVFDLVLSHPVVPSDLPRAEIRGVKLGKFSGLRRGHEARYDREN